MKIHKNVRFVNFFLLTIEFILGILGLCRVVRFNLTEDNMDNLFNLVRALTVSHDAMCGLPAPVPAPVSEMQADKEVSE